MIYANSLHAQTALGEVNQASGAVAFKFASPVKVSRVVDVTWETGSSGRVTPVAIVEPVELAGASVRRASLHNMANVRALGIGVGDEVLVSRRNDVIPYVEEVVEKHGPAAEPPKGCPVCKAPLAIEGEYLISPQRRRLPRADRRADPELDRRRIGALERGWQIDRASRSTRATSASRWISSPQGERHRGSERRGEKIAKKCLDQLASRLPLTLPVFVAALGIENFALQTARLCTPLGTTRLRRCSPRARRPSRRSPGWAP